MTQEDVERLRRVKSFTQLVAYLRDELEWPFTDFDAPEEISFDWSAEELGIDKKSAAGIEEIRQLRPPMGDWPWGIFYVKFEKKRLPITVLRRALASVVRKKRETANTGQRWNLEDLLFISSYGEGEKRQISFARFQSDPSRPGRLPALKVLAWDEDDTDLSLEHTAGELRTKLAWPDDDGEDVEQWRQRWSSAFVREYRATVRTSKELASQLAQLAMRIRLRINQVLSLENEHGPLRQVLASFQASLVHDLDDDGFADMYAQTIAYGLFSARVTNPKGGDAGGLLSVPVTNPFLRELLATFLEVGGRAQRGVGVDFDQLGVNDVVDLLDSTDMEAVLRDFGDKNPMEDPVIHFFEGFLQEYDSQIRKDRGVFYTPRPVVSFIVRSVDELLRTEFGLDDGLADITTWGEMAGRIDDLEIPKGATPDQAFVQILDPATGTGTFLVEVIDLIHKTMTAKWQAEGHGKKKIEKLWNDYVPKHLLPRLHGYELMMAPYAIAHMKIGLKLYETGYRFESDERARVYLTNALEPAQDFSGTLAFAIPALAHEAEAVNAIKRDQRFTVVIGNPPYSGHSSNKGGWITSMLHGDLADGVASYFEIDGRSLAESNTKWLNDDYVKFIRLVQNAISVSSAGVFGFITNSSYLDNPTFRGMRRSLLKTYDEIYVHDLHGSTKKMDALPDGSSDENVFDIQQGVAIQIATKNSGSNTASSQVFHRDVFGSRSKKYDILGCSCPKSSLELISPSHPSFLLVPQDEALLKEFNQGSSITEVMPEYSLGCLTKRDALVTGFEKDEVVENIRRFIDPEKSDEQAANEFGVRISDNDMWSTADARGCIEPGDIETYVRREAFRPFDNRWIFYHKKFVARLNRRVMRHLDCDNVALVLVRQLASLPFDHVWVTDQLADQHLISVRTKEGGVVFPLFLEKDDDELGFGEGRLANISDSFSRNIIAVQDEADLAGHDKSSEIFHFTYAQLHSPAYRARYAELLKREFPRVFLPKSYDLFSELACLGAELIHTHLLKFAKTDEWPVVFVGPARLPVEKASYAEETVWIDKAQTRGFKGVPEEVWNFHIGGYQVCEKWLKDRQAKGGKNPRPGRVLTDEDIEHYQKIVVALSETIRIMAEIDEVIEAHGGWPGAFQTDRAGSDD